MRFNLDPNRWVFIHTLGQYIKISCCAIIKIPFVKFEVYLVHITNHRWLNNHYWCWLWFWFRLWFRFRDSFRYWSNYWCFNFMSASYFKGNTRSYCGYIQRFYCSWILTKIGLERYKW